MFGIWKRADSIKKSPIGRSGASWTSAIMLPGVLLLMLMLLLLLLLRGRLCTRTKLPRFVPNRFVLFFHLLKEWTNSNSYLGNRIYFLTFNSYFTYFIHLLFLKNIFGWYKIKKSLSKKKDFSGSEATPEVWISLFCESITFLPFLFTCQFFLLPTKGRICLSLIISKHEFIPLFFLVLIYSAAAVVVFVSATLCNRHCYYSVFILAAVVQVKSKFHLTLCTKNSEMAV